ncbi:Tc toxin subunit A-related protein [Haladaptatus sp. NG-WS-4]
MAPTEYERLLANISNHLDDAELAELTPEEIRFIAGAADIDPTRIQTLVECARHAGETDLPPAVLYAFASQDLSLDDLLSEDIEDFQRALENAIEECIVPLDLRESFESIFQRLRILRDEMATWDTRELRVNLQDEETGEPVAEYRLHVVELRETGEESIGRYMTDEEGNTIATYRVNVNDPSSREFRFEIVDPNGVSMHEVVVEIEPEQEELTLEIPIVEPPEPKAISLDAVVEVEEEEAFRHLAEALKTKDFKSSRDILKAGGVRNIEGVENLAAEPTIRKLDAHVNLSILPTTVEENATLIDHEFYGVQNIADTPQEKLEAILPPELEPRVLHTTAVVQQDYLKNAGVIHLTEQANGLPSSFDGLDGESRAENPEQEAGLRCTDCEDCESAVSPIAYLADLIQYVNKHVRKAPTTQGVSLDDLGSMLLQPFGSLSASCRAVEETVRQVRLCVEVLRRYEDSQQLSPEELDRLDTFEQTYLRDAYETLLTEIGTSRDELQNAIDGDEESRERLANRLGIGVEHLIELLLTPSDITETRLEALVGLRETNGTDINREVKTSQLEQWRHEYLEGVWYGLDHPVDVYATESEEQRPVIDPDVIGPDDFRNPVANNPAFSLWKKRRTWVDNRVREVRETTIEGDGKPILDVKKLLRKMDNKTRLYYMGKPRPGPWSGWKQLGEASTLIRTFESLFEKLESGDEVESTEEKVKQLSLTVDSFTRLMEIYWKHRKHLRDGRFEAVTDEEWDEFVSILVESMKGSLSELWIEEESNEGVVFGGKTFWKSLREPEQGEWSKRLESQLHPLLEVVQIPKSKRSTPLTIGRPLIDPELVTQKELVETAFRFKVSGIKQKTTAVAVWEDRRAQLNAVTASLEQTYKATPETKNGVEKLLDSVYGAPPSKVGEKVPTWEKYISSVTTAIDLDEASGHQRVANELYLEPAQFSHIVTMWRIARPKSTAKPPSEKDLDELYAVLTTAKKYIDDDKYKRWKTQESSLKYWQVLKARLPTWRASPTTRQLWQRALRSRNQPAIVDPDLVRDAEFANPVQADPAFSLYQQRTKELTDALDRLKPQNLPDTTAKARNHFTKLLRNEVGVAPQELVAIDADFEGGVDVSGRLDQLTLSKRAFDYLHRIWRKIEKDRPVSNEEWDHVYHILLRVWKCRQYTDWRLEERRLNVGGGETGLVLDPAFFTLETELTPGSVWPSEESPSYWLYDREARDDWEDTLEARIDQYENTTETIEELVSTIEEETLPALRDGLVEVLADGDPTGAGAEWVTNILLIDGAASGCQETTRMAQAIETIQAFIETLRSEDEFTAVEGTTVELVDDQYDKRWKWLGSYATWKSAMSVFLYPDNVLDPTLQRETTPAFETAMDSLTSSHRLTPDRACRIAQEYSDYYRDIASLTFDATCWGNTRITSGGSCEETEEGRRDLFYMFARGGDLNIPKTGSTTPDTEGSTVYWSAYDPAKSGGEQTYWEAIDGLSDVAELFGAVPYRGKIYLFAKQVEDGIEKLVFTHYDLDTHNWLEKPESLKLPSDADSFHALVIQQPNTDYRPELIIQVIDDHEPIDKTAYAYKSYYFVFNPSENGWAEEEEEKQEAPITSTPRPSSIAIAPKIPAVWAQNVGRFFWLFTDSGNEPQPEGLSFTITGEKRGGNLKIQPSVVWWPSNQGMLVDNIGAVHDDDGNIHLYYGEETISRSAVFGPTYKGSKSVSDTRVGKKSEIVTGIIPYEYPVRELQIPLSIVGIARHCGGYPKPDADWMFVGLQTKDSKTHEYVPGSADLAVFRSLYISKVDPAVDESGRTKLDLEFHLEASPQVPHTQESFKIPQQLSGRQDLRRRHISFVFSHIEWSTSSIPHTSLVNENNSDYVREAYYFIPMLIASQLGENGEYDASLDWYRTIYDYTISDDGNGSSQNSRRIFPLSKLNKGVYSKYTGVTPSYQREEDWLVDPLDPHQVAATKRPKAYTRFTLVSIIRSLLDYADAEFTYDTSESVPRARRLYEQAQELLESDELQREDDPCAEVEWTFREHETVLGLKNDPVWSPMVQALEIQISNIEKYSVKRDAVQTVLQRLSDGGDVGENITASMEYLNEIGEAESPPSYETLFDIDAERRKGLQSTILANDYLQERLVTLGKSVSQQAKQNSGKDEGTSNEESFDPDLHLALCIPANPILKSLDLRATYGLFKLRNCMNIAGMRRQLEPYAASIDVESGLPTLTGGRLSLPGTVRFQPTQYRYTALVARAEKLAEQARNVEASFLSALERYDQEEYQRLQAQQSLQQARAGVRLQNLRVREAKDGVKLAELQRDRSKIEAETYDEWITAGLSEYERKTITALNVAAVMKSIASGLSTGGRIAELAASFNPYMSAAIAQYSAAEAFTQAAIFTETQAQVYGIQASHERSKQQWELQKTLAEKDIEIGEQQIRIAQDHVEVVGQEREISKLQADHAKGMLEFLDTKFLNRHLYLWMSRVLEDVYSYFLQRATTVAKLAENQLAFERQETPAAIIQEDYWNVPSENMLGDGMTEDRRGLTGSARLLQDITKLNEYALTTDERAHQLTKTFSLSQLAPYEFQRFRETGVLNFATPMEAFDWDFPGHHLRLIKRVRTSVIALVPPTEGIKATLSNSGLSRVVTGGDIFQTRVIRRQPESVALTSPTNTTGLFELQPESQDKLFPFEKTGVDTTWEFRMPKASNPIDYDSIADVLVTIEYTALDSETYRQQVLQELEQDPKRSGERAFTLKNEFADQWYDLNNPEQSPTPMTVSFETTRDDFPPNLDDIEIKQVLLYFVSDETDTLSKIDVGLYFSEEGSDASIGGEAAPVDGVISTRRANAGGWYSITGGSSSPVGEWTLSLPNTPAVSNLFENDNIQDILFVVTYEGDAEYWVE